MREAMRENGLMICSVIGAGMFIGALGWMLRTCGQVIQMLFP